MFRTLSTAVLLLLLALPGVALAQSTGTLTGTVVDDQGVTLIGASVRVEGTTLGAATNVDGQYRIIGVPVGEYEITASYIGFQSETQSGVTITNAVTRVVDFQLGSDAQLDEVIVEYERPIIERGATAPRSIGYQEIENLPVRNVGEVAALQSGVVGQGNGDLNIRGGRAGEVAYFVDGVRVTGDSPAINQAAIAEQEMLIGTIPARYGDVQSGVISITTQTGRSDFFGSAEAITSRGLDSYGYNLASFSLGGPIVPNRIGFFATAEGEFLDDASPYGTSSLRLNDDMFDMIQQRPQALLFTNEDGDRRFIPFPAEQFDDRPLQNPNGSAGTITAAEIDEAYEAAGVVPEGFTRSDLAFVPTAGTLTEESFSEQRGKDDPSDEITVNGSLNFTILPSVTLRVGGGYQNDSDRNFSYARSFYDRNYSRTEGEYWRTYGTLRQRVGTNAFYQITAEYQNNYESRRAEGLADDLSQTLFYGDIENDRYAVARRYFAGTADGAQRRNFQDSNISIGQVDPGTFTLPGNAAVNIGGGANFSRSRTEQFGITGDASTQVGVHQIGFGGEYRQNTNRFFSIDATDVSAFFADGVNVRSATGIPAEGVTEYEDLSYPALQPLVTYYGYTFNGMDEVDDQDVDGFYNMGANGVPQNTNIDAWRPYYYAGFITDRIEFNDLILDLGFRVDAYNANTLVLRDIFANRPIIRAGDLDGITVPGNVGSDFGVYYQGGVTSNPVVGYRDLEGTIYNASGEQITNADLEAANGSHVIDDTQSEGSVFRESDTDFSFMPRIGVSFPVTDRALFFASYNVLAQRPTQNSFTTFNRYVAATTSSRLNNTGLEPQRTTQYEVGFRQRVGERAALTISGFYNTKDNLIALRNADGGLTGYSYYTNRDFSTTQGGELGFELRRTNNLALNANYTLSFAKASGSDSNTLATIAWRGDTFPNFISPADFDQRHTFNLTADYRFGAGEGPMIGNTRPFENFGVNLIGQFGSGQRYTPLQRCGDFTVNDSRTCDTTGDINSSVLPANYNLDLKLDRRFQLGFAESTMQLYLIVLNVLDTENVFAVYRETGQVDNQGFFNGSVGAQRLGAFQSPESTLFNYQAYTGGPVNVGGAQSSGASFYGPPRRIRLGALFTF